MNLLQMFKKLVKMHLSKVVLDWEFEMVFYMFLIKPKATSRISTELNTAIPSSYARNISR